MGHGWGDLVGRSCPLRRAERRQKVCLSSPSISGVRASRGTCRLECGLEIYVLNDSDSVVSFDKTRPHGLWGKGMLHGQFGKNQRLMTGSYQAPIDIQVADIDGDGVDEALVAGTQLSQLWQP